MKIRITYTPEEARQVETLLTFLRRFLPETRTRRSDRHTPFKHVYLTTNFSQKH